MTESSPCSSSVPPVYHPDVCEPVKDTPLAVNVIDDGSDKTTVHDNALTGCLADGCHHHGTGYLPLVKLGTVPSNAQLCRSSVDGHQCRMLGMIPCATMVEKTVHINVAQTFEENRMQDTFARNVLNDCAYVSSSSNFCNYTPTPCETLGNCSTCTWQDDCQCQQSNINFLIGVATSETGKLLRE